MRVLLNALQAGNRSGTGKYIESLLPALLRSADDLEVVIAWPWDVPVPDFEGHVAVYKRDARHLRRLLYDQFFAERQRRDVGADLIHYPANFGRLWGGTRAVLTVHDLSFLRHPEWFRPGRAAYYRFAARHSVRHARRVIADSQATADDIHAMLGLPMERIDVVPLGVGPAFSPASAEAHAAVCDRYDLPPRFFLYVGTLEPRKNLPRLIDAWTDVQDNEKPDLVLAGREGWKAEPIREAIARSAQRDRIHLPGFVAQEDLPALLSAAEAFVWPSLFEGFGLPPLEAMACGTPVLTSNTSSLPEVVGDAAYTVAPERTEAITEGLSTLATSPETRTRLSEAGLQRAADFSWERTAQLTIESYRKALAE
jgi:glycosyltransferase involved in cell wall biosynthesis